MHTVVTSETINILSDTLAKKFNLSGTGLERAIRNVLEKTEKRKSPGISFSTMFRGLRALRFEPLNEKTKEEDIRYVRALTTGANPGSFVVPTWQANDFLEYLNLGGCARAAGARIWPMVAMQRMTVPIGSGAPSWAWTSQNSIQSAVDPSLTQATFNLFERRALIVVSNALVASSVPELDTVLSLILADSAAEHEDAAFFAATQAPGAPIPLYASSGISTLLVGASANGGNLAYSDLLALLAKTAAVKARGPFAFFVSPRTMYSRILGLIDLQSRPLAIPTAFQGLQAPVRLGAFPQFTIFGYPTYVTPALPENLANGSGTNQSAIILCNPANTCHIGQNTDLEFSVSTERYWDSGMTGIRGVMREDFQFQPAAGICALLGVN